MRDRHGVGRLQMPPMPLSFKVWMAFCAVLGLTVLGVALWAVTRLVTHFT